MTELTNKELEHKIELLERDMNTSYERLRADMAQRDINMAERENRQLLATIVIVGVAAAVLGLLITAQ